MHRQLKFAHSGVKNLAEGESKVIIDNYPKALNTVSFASDAKTCNSSKITQLQPYNYRGQAVKMIFARYS
jgi:hypothetical protein